MRPANLAGRPFRNERLPNLIVAAGLAATLVLTAWHALVVRALLPARTSALHEEVARLEEEERRLRADQASLRRLHPEPEALARWTLVKDLVDRRAFSWTQLFARLEEKLPQGARVVSIAPSVRGGAILLEVQAVMRSPEVGWEFMRALEEGGDFEDVFPLSEGEKGEFRYTMRYRPRAEPSGSAAAAEVSLLGTDEAGPAAALRAEGPR
ncbi:MAG TPA: hypothetical protein VMR21_16245 [Vicinamibacteria bacterium]|nr:hypothetical protein [Vicinamibacteria bacterium]